MEQKQKLAIINKDKEPIKRRITRGMVSVTNGNIVEQKKEAICNSIGPDVRNGFNGAIGKSIVGECGEAIINECYEETKKVYDTDGIMKEGQFVTTSAGNSDTFKNVIHCVCPSSVDENADEILTNLVYQVLMFCNKSMVDSFATPPMSSGILGFSFERCARCFFTAIMNFLEDIDHKTTLKSLSFVIYEKVKSEDFQEIWEELMVERFGSLESEDESDDEPLPAGNRMVAQPPKEEKKSTGQIKTNKKYNSSSDEEEKKTEKSKIENYVNL